MPTIDSITIQRQRRRRGSQRLALRQTHQALLTTRGLLQLRFNIPGRQGFDVFESLCRCNVSAEMQHVAVRVHAVGLGRLCRNMNYAERLADQLRTRVFAFSRFGIV